MSDGRRVDGDAEERGLELTEGMGAGQEVDHEPALGAGERTAPERGNEPRTDHRGLPRTRGSDHREEPRAVRVLREPPDEPVRQRLAPEEVRGIRLEEGAEPLERVTDLGPIGATVAEPSTAARNAAASSSATGEAPFLGSFAVARAITSSAPRGKIRANIASRRESGRAGGWSISAVREPSGNG